MVTQYVLRDPENRAANVVLPMFRALSAPWVVTVWPSQNTAIANVAENASFDSGNAVTAEIEDGIAEAASRAAAEREARSNATTDARNAAAAANATNALITAGSVDATETSAFRSAVGAAFRAATNVSAHLQNVPRFWAPINADVDAVNAGLSPTLLMRRPLKPEEGHWAGLKTALLELDQNWHVWTDWYDDRLRGADDPRSRPLIEDLEVERVQIPNEDWEKGPEHVNAIIAALEAKHRGQDSSRETTPDEEEVSALIAELHEKIARQERRIDTFIAAAPKAGDPVSRQTDDPPGLGHNNPPEPLPFDEAEIIERVVDGLRTNAAVLDRVRISLDATPPLVDALSQLLVLLQEKKSPYWDAVKSELGKRTVQILLGGVTIGAILAVINAGTAEIIQLLERLINFLL